MLDVGLGVGAADTGNGHACGVGQIGQPVGARLRVLSRVGEQQPYVVIGSRFALSGISQRGEQRVLPVMTAAATSGTSRRGRRG